MKVLICGAGIAGLTLGWRLLQLGHVPEIIEHAAGPRAGGYMIDFFGSGFDAAEKMGLLPELERIHYPIARFSFLDGRGRERYSLRYKLLRKRLFENRHFNFLRGDLERVLYSRIEGKVRVRFGTTIDSFDQDAGRVTVTLSDGSKEDCDVLAGADGVHSRVRSLAFGDEARFSRFLGFHAAAFILNEVPRALASVDAFETLTVPNRQVAIYPIRGGRLATLFVHRAERPAGNRSREEALRELREIYGDLNWIVPDLLKAAGAAELYFDDIAQIELPRWSSGRVVLAGDSCQCVSLLAGQGASLAMAAAYVLSGEMNTKAAVAEALEAYEQRVKPVVQKKQAGGRKMAGWFAPRNSMRIMLRDLVFRLSAWPVVARLARKSLTGDEIALE